MAKQTNKEAMQSLCAKAVMARQMYSSMLEKPDLMDYATKQGLVKELNKIKGYCQLVIDDLAKDEPPADESV